MDRAFLIRSVSLLCVKHAFRVMTVTYLPSLCPDACTLPVTTIIFQPNSQKALCIWNFAFSWPNFRVFIDQRRLKLIVLSQQHMVSERNKPQTVGSFCRDVFYPSPMTINLC